MIFKLTRPTDGVTGRHLDVVSHASLHVFHHRAHVAAFDENTDRHGAPAGFAGDVHGAVGFANGGHAAQLRITTIGRGNQRLRQAGNRAFAFWQAHRHRKFTLAFPQLRGRFAAQRCFHHILNVLHVQAEPCGAVTVDVDHQLRQVTEAVNLAALHPLDLFDFTLNGFGHAAQFTQVFAGHLDDDLALDLRYGFQHVVANRLRERWINAGNRPQLAVHLVDQLVAGQALAPFFLRLHVDENLRHAEGFGVGAVFGLASLGHGGAHFGHAVQGIARQQQYFGRLDAGDAGRHVEIGPEGAFVELGQKLRPEPRCRAHGQRKHRQRNHHHGATALQRPQQHGFINAFAAGHDAVVTVRNFFAQHPKSQQGHQRQRENQRADQGRGDAQRHRLKDAAFMALQRKNRNVCSNDDQHREQRWPADFVGRVNDDAAPLGFAHAFLSL